MYWELSQKDFVFQKCSLVSVSETSFKEIKQRKKEENFTVVFPYFFKKSNVFQKQRYKLSKYVGNANGVFCSLIMII